MVVDGFRWLWVVLRLFHVLVTTLKKDLQPFGKLFETHFRCARI